MALIILHRNSNALGSDARERYLEELIPLGQRVPPGALERCEESCEKLEERTCFVSLKEKGPLDERTAQV